MIVVMREGAAERHVEAVIARLADLDLSAHVIHGVRHTVLGAIGDQDRKEEARLAIETMEMVDRVVPILTPYKLAARHPDGERSVVDVQGVRFGPGHFTVIAGPCTVENREQILETARAVSTAGARVLRGGAFKPRTSPYSFQGLAEDGLKMLAEARDETGLLIATEVMDPRAVELVARYSDILQIGTRNMQNYDLLREIGRSRTPAILKRGMSATIEEWLMAAEYILAGGNGSVILCERGIRTFETYTRNTLDLVAIPAAQELTHLPVIADPSHGTGRFRLVPAASRAALAIGADGLLIEVHPNPAQSVSDGPQTISTGAFTQLMDDLRRHAVLLERTV